MKPISANSHHSTTVVVVVVDFKPPAMNKNNGSITFAETHAFILLETGAVFKVPIQSPCMTFDEITTWLKDLRHEYGPSASLLLERPTGSSIS